MFISPLFGPKCRFYPCCSEYCRQVVIKHGVAKGFLLSAKRLLKCGPWHPGGVDLPPSQ